MGLPKNPLLGLNPLGSSGHSGSNNHLRILRGTGRCCLLSLFWSGNFRCWLGTVSLTTNPVPIAYGPRQCWSLLGFMLIVVGSRFSLCAYLGVLPPTTLGHSQLHQKHLMKTTCFDGAPSANTPPFFQSRHQPNRFLGARSIGGLPFQVTSAVRPFQCVENCVDSCFVPTEVTLVLSRMVMLLRDLHYDFPGSSEGYCQVRWQCQPDRWPWHDLNAGPFFWLVSGLDSTDVYIYKGALLPGELSRRHCHRCKGAELVGVLLRSHSQMGCHLDIGATLSVQATTHQRWHSFFISPLLALILQTARLGAVAFTVLCCELSCQWVWLIACLWKAGCATNLQPHPGCLPMRHIEVPAGVPPVSDHALASYVFWSPLYAVHHRGCLWLPFPVDVTIQDAFWRPGHTCTRQRREEYRDHTKADVVSQQCSTESSSTHSQALSATRS